MWPYKIPTTYLVFSYLGTDTGKMETATEVESLEPEELADVESAHKEGVEVEGEEVRDKMKVSPVIDDRNNLMTEILMMESQLTEIVVSHHCCRNFAKD